MRQWIARQRVHSQLQHDHIRVVGFRKRKCDLCEGVVVCLVIGSNGQWYVGSEPFSGSRSNLILKACAREKRPSAFMQRDGHDIAFLIERVLHTATVMDIKIQEQNALSCIGQQPRGQHDIVHIAEAGGKLRSGVMKPAGRVEGSIGRAIENHAGCRE